MEKRVADLIADERCQARERMSGETIEEYAELYRAEETFPPLEVFNVDGKLVIVDGFHRHEAALRAAGPLAGVATLPVKVVGYGSMPDAMWYAVGTNRKHGLKRTRADKRKAVEMAIKLDAERSDREIARQAGVSHTMVSKMRRVEQLKIPAVQADPEELRQEADQDFQSGNFERAKVTYEKAIAASRAQYTPLRIELASAPRLCAEQSAPAKRQARIRRAKTHFRLMPYGPPVEIRPRCTLCGLEGSVSLQLHWTCLDICTACLDAMHEKSGAAHELARQADQAEAAE